MKFRIKKRNIRERIDNFFNEAHHNYERRIREKCDVLENWHEKFAWYPMRVENDDDDTREWVWLEKVTQKYIAGVQTSDLLSRKVIKKFSVERYTSKDYFKKRLQGEVDGKSTSGVDGEYVNMKHDGTNFSMRSNAYKEDYFFAQALQKNNRQLEEDDG